MIRSMTGFGMAAGQVGDVEYSVEVRSVNNRYFKTNIKTPENFAAIEPAVEKAVRERVTRGSVYLQVRAKLSEAVAAYHVNVSVLNSYLEQLRLLEVEANPMLRVDLATLLELPGVAEPPELAQIAEATRDGLLKLVCEALDGLCEMRQREGQALEKDLLGNCEQIEQVVRGVAERTGEVVKLYHQRLCERVEELVQAAKIKIDEESLAREVAIFAERSDIAEEISRLTGHVEQFRETITEGGSAGRKLDFIAQEMLREANTIGSKANDADISQKVVEIKTAIDRIKEQVQNVE
jgi:uncharacterized protein (TIGR00255 family)